MFQETPLFYLYVASGIMALFLAIRTWQLRPARGAFYWSIALMFTFFFALGSGLEVILRDTQLKMMMIPVLYLGLTGFCVSFLLFSITYVDKGHWLTPRNIVLVSIIPAITFVLALFYTQHELIYRDYQYIEVRGLLIGTVVEYGWFFYVWAIYAYAVVLFGAGLIIYMALQSPTVFRGQAFLVVLGVSIATSSGIFYLVGFNPIAPIDPSPFTFSVSGALIYLGMIRFRFLEMTPVANELIFNSMTSGFIIVDPNNHILNVNRRAENILQHKRDALIGKEVSQFVPTFQMLTSGAPINSEPIVTIINERYFDVKINRILSRRGDMRGMVLLFYDITERLQNEQHALDLALERERFHLLQRFISDASHDFRTPLAIIKTNTYILHRKLEGDEDKTARLDTINTQAEHINDLLEGMLTMLRLERNDIDIRQVSLNRMLQMLISRFETSTGRTINLSSPDQEIVLQASEEELVNALANIFQNAISYSSDTIEVVVQVIDKTVEIKLVDYGIGISDYDLPRIFERFYRGDHARNTQLGSTGLGLAIAKRVIERHKGTIHAESTLDEGTAITISLPYTNDTATT